MAAQLTRKDIAKAAGVSPSTVSRALSGSKLIPETTVAMIRELAERMGYRPNILAKRLAVNRSFQIGFVLPLGLNRKGPLQMSYYSTILDGMVGAAFPRGFSVGIHPYAGESEDAAAGLADIVGRRDADGLVLLGLKQGSPIPDALLKASVPFVLIGSSHRKASSVNCDPGKALKDMLKVVKSLSYERLVYVKGAPNYYDAALQASSLEQGLKETPFANFETLEGDYSRTSGYKAADALFSKGGLMRSGRVPKTCVFLACDRMAMGFYRYCQEHGIAIPEEVGVVGSDRDDAALGLHPELSTMRQPRLEMGRAAMDLLIDLCEGPASQKPRSLMIEEMFLKRDSI